MANEITEIGLFYNQIPSAPPIESVSFENFLKLHIINEGNEDYLFFNLLKKINLIDSSSELNPDFFDTYVIDSDMTWGILSYNIYNTLNLWWLLCLVNNIQDPTKNPENGSYIKAIKPKFVNMVIKAINSQIVL